MRNFGKHFGVALTFILISGCEAPRIQEQVELTKSQQLDRDSYVDKMFDISWQRTKEKIGPQLEAKLSPKDLEELNGIYRELAGLDWLLKNSDQVQLKFPQDRDAELKGYELADRLNKILEPIYEQSFIPSPQIPFDRDKALTEAKENLRKRYEKKYYSFTEEELTQLATMNVDINILQPQYRRAYRLENMDSYETTKELTKKKNDLWRELKRLEGDLKTRPRRTDQEDIRIKEALARGETIDRPKLGVYTRKTLTETQKLELREKKLKEINALMTGADIRLPQDKVEQFINWGEVIHEIGQDRSEAAYYMSYNNQTEDGFYIKNFQEASERLRKALNENTKITSTLKLARLQNKRPEILQENQKKLRKTFEQRHYSYTEEELMHYAELGLDIDVAREQYNLELSDPSGTRQVFKDEQKSLNEQRQRLLIEIQKRPRSQPQHVVGREDALPQDVVVPSGALKVDTTQPSKVPEIAPSCDIHKTSEPRAGKLPGECFAKVITRTGTEWKQILCENDASAEVIEKIQTALIKRGDYNGPINGRLDIKTYNGVTKFQRRHGLSGGGLTLETVECMGVDWKSKN